MFTPRTSVFSPTSMYGNDWWYDVSKNPFAGSQSLWLPNCTTYAYGRAGEMKNVRQNLPTGNAGEWFPEAASRGFQTGITPKLGAIACWEDITGGAGHLAVVESLKKNPDGTFYDVYVSESFYNTDKSFRPDFPYFRYAFLYDVNTNQPYLSWMLRADYNFQGYIYILPETAGLDPVTIALLGNRRRRFKRR